MCELLVGLSAVTVLELLEGESGLRVKVQTSGRNCLVRRAERWRIKDRLEVDHADLPCSRADDPGVAQLPLAVPDHKLRDGIVHRASTQIA